MQGEDEAPNTSSKRSRLPGIPCTINLSRHIFHFTTKNVRYNGKKVPITLLSLSDHHDIISVINIYSHQTPFLTTCFIHF